MNQGDHLYQVQKNSAKPEDRDKFKTAKHEVDCMVKTLYNSYLDSLVGITDDSEAAENSRPNTKKLFSYLKNCSEDSQGSAPLKENGQVSTDNVKKTKLLNNQFQSVFTSKSPFDLKQSCRMRVQDLQDAGHGRPESLPNESRNKYPNMKDISISVNGIISCCKV